MLSIPASYIKAGAPAISVEDLRELANSDNDRVRRRVAENLRCPLDVLEQLSSDPCTEVRCAVGANPNTPYELVNRLANDNNPDVRFSIAENHQMHIAILQNLTNDDNCYVRERAQGTILRIENKDFHSPRRLRINLSGRQSEYVFSLQH